MEGVIIGFDEFMNLVLDNAEEINVKTSTRKSLGKTHLYLYVYISMLLYMCVTTSISYICERERVA